MRNHGVSRVPSLPPTGFAQFLEKYLHIIAHLFASQAVAGKDMLRRKGSQGCFAEAVCSSCFSTSSSSWYQRLGGMPRGKPGQWIIPCPTIYTRVYREETEVTSSLGKLFPPSLPTQSPLPPMQGLSLLPLPGCHNAADSSCQDGRPHALRLSPSREAQS